MSVFTSQQTNSTLTLDENSGLKAVSLNLVSGSATVKGTMNVNGFPSSAISLTVGVPVTIILSGAIEISFPAGVVSIIGI